MCWLLLSCIWMYSRLKIEYLFLAHTLTMSFITLLYAHSYPARCSQGFLNPFSSVQSLSRVQLFEPHELQHARPPCPSPTSRVHPNPCPLSQWCHPIISSSVVLSSSCPQSFPASVSFQMSQLFASGGQSIGVSTSAPVLPMKTQD